MLTPSALPPFGNAYNVGVAFDPFVPLWHVSATRAQVLTPHCSARRLSPLLGGHFKTGHSWTDQNRPPRGVATETQ